jgi:hypothetical protein
MGSVDGWPLAISPFQIPGGTAGTGSVQATCRACWPPLGAVCYSPEARPFGVPPVPVADLALGNSVGAIRMVPGTLRVRLRRPVGDRVFFTPAVISTFSVPPAWGVRPGLFGGSRQGRIWLILPVVICLSQRLSHACLSISTLVP